jgi:2-oxoglutarate ferredoxin oxidoreductase subunit alpha
MNELAIDPAKLIAVLHYDGTPITARFISGAITRHVHAEIVAPKPGSRAAKETVK